MSKKYIGKKIFALLFVGAVVGGAIAFFKKFEKENEEDYDYSSFEAPDVDLGFNEDDARNYTTISGEKDEHDAPTETPSDSDSAETASADQVNSDETDSGETDSEESANV